MQHTTIRNADLLTIPHIGGKLAVFVFIITLLAFVLESELTQYVQTTLNYRQPFFLFYMVHSSLSIIFPLHMLYLLATTNYKASSLVKGLAIAISTHLAPNQRYGAFRIPVAKFLRLTLALTVGVTMPGLLWFTSVSLTSMTDLTAIGNTNAFFAYIISVFLFKLPWEPKRLLAIVLATLGTFAVVYGGVAVSKDKHSTEGQTTNFDHKPSPLIGNLLALIGSFAYGSYQVLYKLYAALPSDPEVATERMYEEIPGDEVEEAAVERVDKTDAVCPPPFGLHPNFITSVLGLFTFIFLWIPLPILHWSGAEPFVPPPNKWTALIIASIALTGSTSVAGSMVLLGIWGPIIVSVGNLLTIVLILVADVLFGPGLEVLTFWSLLGSGVIVLAFAVLSYDTFTKKT